MAKEVREEHGINDRSKMQEKEIHCFEKEIEYVEPKEFINKELEDFNKRKTYRTIEFGAIISLILLLAKLIEKFI